METPELLTLGHGTLDRGDLAHLLAGASVRHVVDVRRFPGSRRHPHVARDALSAWLAAIDVAYTWDVRLGGRRQCPPDTPDIWWELSAFRGYAAHMRTGDFAAAATELVAAAAERRTAMLCSETLWWRCHRRLVADHVLLVHAMPVSHLGHDGALRTHVPSAGARRREDGLLVYDGGQGPLDPREA